MKNINELLRDKFREEDFSREYYREAAFFRLADQLLLMRKKRGLTQKELAEKVGTTQAVISRLENVSVKPSLETIVKIAEALDTVVEVQLKPFEEVQPFAENEVGCEEISQKKQETLKAILLYEQSKPEEKELDVSIKLENIPFSLTTKPTNLSVGRKKKEFEYA